MNQVVIDNAIKGLHKLFMRNALRKTYFLTFWILDRYATESFVERIKILGFHYMLGRWQAEDINEKKLFKRLKLIKQFILANQGIIKVECKSQIGNNVVTI